MTGRAVRWVSDEPFPGWVQVQITDAHGVVWSLFDKPTVFDDEDRLRNHTAYPVDVEVPCEVVGRGRLTDGTEVLTISTRLPFGIEAQDGRTEFLVDVGQVSTG
ncbi:hypothetical protein [Saccharothrix hoggarensis]|uniref:Uncharacterized protein n=1 Tax=Saccharothrix hoggarensis TaxID=913853 RepID=A0ABW3QQP6_9PSEU